MSWNDLEFKELIGERVLSAKRVRGGVCFQEECDGWFGEVLTLEEVEALIAAIRAIASEPEPPAPSGLEGE